MISFQRSVLFVIMAFLLTAMQQVKAQNVAELRDHVNQGSVGIMCGRSTGALLPYCEDMAAELNDNLGYSLRVVPMIGEGSMRNVEDILYLKGVDLALANADTLDFMQRQNIHPNIKERLSYITSLESSVLHLVSTKGIASIYDLEGKKVNFGTVGSGTFLTMTNTFEALNINVDVQSDVESVALERLKQGEIDAIGINASIPSSLVQSITAEDNLKLLNVPVDCLSGPYETVVTESAVYPSLIPTDLDWTAPRVRVVLLAYRWPNDHPRCGRVKRFATALLDNIPSIKQGLFKSRWGDVDPDAEVKDLIRWDGSCS